NHLESNKLNPKEKDEYTQLITRRESKELTTVAEMLGSKVGNATSIRASQAVVVAKEIRNSPYQVVVCGDFNDVPGSYVYRTISKGMTDCWIDKGSGWGNTFHENLFLFRIDYILHSKNIETVTIKRDKVRISDHYPLLATLKIE
ncbi:MAG: endonuclease/exonuclease/phosphatase family protein, partial [Bacteroidota bacterium]|nr:endonuclease/exonuclease/phosphatase family protein [Bacteroidota bacterium]